MNNKICLNGTWQFCEKGINEWKKGMVPGSVQLDLINEGSLPDPFYRLNEYYFYPLHEKQWIYRRTFDFNDDPNCFSGINIVFEGIDTYAEIFVNGHCVGNAENMLIPYAYDIRNVIKQGKNLVEVCFDSTKKVMDDLAEKYPVTKRNGNHVYVRRAQVAFGWDWAPEIILTGLWRPVYIELIEKAKMENPFFYTVKLEGKDAVINLSTEIEAFDRNLCSKTTLEVDFSVSYDNKTVAAAKVPVRETASGLGAEVRLKIKDVLLWYPNGTGEQPRYDVSIKLFDSIRVLDTTSFKSGIRIIKLIREKDSEGESFIFEINGNKIFVKGANWVIADMLFSRLTSDDYYQFVKLAKDCNMNMLRASQGIYEDSSFYNACDELGIMIWQEFSYSGSTYPDEFEWFQKLAVKEADVVVKQLRNHPSIVTWCGNNECNWAFKDNKWMDIGEPKYLGNYLYKELFPEICSKLDPSREYRVSSPYGGEFPNSPNEGNRHNWDFFYGFMWDYKNFTSDTGRFLSEFGFQGMPCWKTILSFTEPEDRHIFSTVMRSHNKGPEWTVEMVKHLVWKVGFPKDFRNFVYLSQFNQAEAIKTGVEHWRSRKFLTAGTLYWQFNDYWPEANWSAIDFYKRKKGLYFYTKKFYNNVLPVLKYEDGKIVLYIVNDNLVELNGSIRISVYSLDGDKKAEDTFTATIGANDVTIAKAFTDEDLNIGYSGRPSLDFGRMTYVAVEKNAELLDSIIYAEVEINGEKACNYLVFDKFRDLILHSPCIKTLVSGNELTLVSDKPAFSVFVEPENDVDMSDNCLYMEPGIEYKITFSGDPGKVEVLELTQMVGQV